MGLGGNSNGGDRDLADNGVRVEVSGKIVDYVAVTPIYKLCVAAETMYGSIRFLML